jgi:sulfate adenylyltransferase
MHSPRVREGFTLFLTGLPGAGKSSIASILLARLPEMDERPVTLLDGDAVRRHISVDLGFSKEDRDLNIRRIAMIAAEISKNGGITICASIAPYDAARRETRALIESGGGRFLLVHVATPLAVCERRDLKGLYAKARLGSLLRFTGVSDPYEVPTDAELVIDTTGMTPGQAAQIVIDRIEKEGYFVRTEPSPLRRELQSATR